MLDDATVQRGIEGYLPKQASLYPARFYATEQELPGMTKKLREEARMRGEDPDTVPPVFETREYCEVKLPGGDIYDGPATEELKQTYPREYAAFKRGQEFTDGTSLDDWARMPKSTRMKCQLLNIFTLEQFIAAPGPVLQQLGPDIPRLQQEAKKFLGAAVVSRRIEAEAEKEARIAELEETVKRLLAAQNGAKAKQKDKEL